MEIFFEMIEKGFLVTLVAFYRDILFSRFYLECGIDWPLPRLPSVLRVAASSMGSPQQQHKQCAVELLLVTSRANRALIGAAVIRIAWRGCPGCPRICAHPVVQGLYII